MSGPGPVPQAPTFEAGQEIVAMTAPFLAAVRDQLKIPDGRYVILMQVVLGNTEYTVEKLIVEGM